VPASPVLLAYDDLPPGSDIRREYADDGGLVKITAPAGEAPAGARRAAAQAALVSGAVSSWAILLLTFVVFAYFVRINRVSGTPLTWAIAFFAIFCTAIVGLVAWVRFGIKLEDLQAGRRQTTVIAVTRDRLLVETTGPFGIAGYDLPRHRLVAVAVARELLRDADGRGRRLEHLQLRLAGGHHIWFLPGRDRGELTWVARAIGRTMNVPVSA
jgi:hypothetical protein